MLRLNQVLGAGVLSLAAAAPAFSAVAYYRFENNLTSQDNSPTLDAAAGSTAGYSTDLPGTSIYDPWASTTVANAASYNNGTGTGSALADTSILNNTISNGGFTIEAFIKLTSSDVNDLKFDLIVGNLDSLGTKGWLFGLGGDGKLRFSSPRAYDGAYVELKNPNTLSSGWHHVAVVGMFTNRDGNPDYTDVTMYVDYSSVASYRYFGSAASGNTGQAGPVFVTSTDPYKIGAINPFSGLIDELRISDSPLQTSQMLQAVVPEPSGLLVIGLAGLGLARRRRR